MFTAAEDWEPWSRFAVVPSWGFVRQCESWPVIDGSLPPSFVYLFVYALMSEFLLTCMPLRI
jgi:hypothetical protein